MFQTPEKQPQPDGFIKLLKPPEHDLSYLNDIDKFELKKLKLVKDSLSTNWALSQSNKTPLKPIQALYKPPLKKPFNLLSISKEKIFN